MNLQQEIRKEVTNLFPTNLKNKSETYRTSKWIFPNHIDPMIKISNRLCNKYKANKKICEIACLLHDTGLVYKKNTSPEGHEKRSIEFAEKILPKYNLKKEQIKQIINCIKATHTDYKPKQTEEKIVRTADTLSQFQTIHFMAKAHFYEDWNQYLNFLEKKLTKGYKKICFKEEKEKIKPIRDYYLKILKQHQSQIS